MNYLEKDERGLYINADNYAECLSNIIISEIINNNGKTKRN